MKSKIFTLFAMLMIVSYVPFSVHTADALSCGIPPFTEAFASHDLLLHGTLIKKELEISDMYIEPWLH